MNINTEYQQPIINAEQVLKILEMQLEVLKMLSSPAVYIPAGSGVDESALKEWKK